ncbi:MAG: hypothetical protein LBH42_07930 [Treponema sp.]|jgi:hypothetical protein|nr:hypothetical protein [Treponema sp.]
MGSDKIPLGMFLKRARLLAKPFFHAIFSFMEAVVKCVSSAFRHGETMADILRAFETFIYEGPLEDFDNKYLLLGFNIKGNLIEVMYNRINEDTVKVFHAMPCRRIFHELIEH